MIKLNVRMVSELGVVLDYDVDVDSKEDFIDNMSKGFRDNIPFVVADDDKLNIVNPSRIMAIQIEEIEDV